VSIGNHTSWIEYKGREILYVDYSGLHDEELANATFEVNNFLKKLGKDEILILVDVRNSYAYEKLTVEAFKKNATIAKQYTKKTAIIGVTKTQEVILTVVNMFSGLGIKPFNNVEEAKDWLIE
jgi:ribosomal protein S21